VKEVPAFERVAPQAPDWLPLEARAEWDRVTPEMDRLGILKRIDGTALAAYCMAWDRFVTASAIVAEEGMVLHDDKAGRAQRHPALLTAEAASKELRAWANEFGLTPSAEQRLATKADGNGDQGNPFAAPSKTA
jgi:P27 family predicted phage terminase small subunit